jgi:hypothetical protein
MSAKTDRKPSPDLDPAVAERLRLLEIATGMGAE